MKRILQNIRVLMSPGRYRAELRAAERMRGEVREAARGGAERLCAEGTAGSNGAADRIRGFLGSRSWEVRNCALKLIAETRCAQLYGTLTAKLLEREEVGIVRRNCAELLPSIGLRSPEVLSALRQALGDGYWEVRAEAARALAGESGQGSVVSGQQPGKDGQGAEAEGQWAGWAELEAEILARLLHESNLEARGALVQALGALGTGRAAFDALADCARDDESWLVRHQAATAIAEMAARKRELAGEAASIICSLDLLADGTATTPVFRQHVLELAKLTADGRLPAREEVTPRYLHLKNGWLRKNGE